MFKKKNIKKEVEETDVENNDHKFVKKELFVEESEKEEETEKKNKPDRKKDKQEHEKEISEKLMEIYENNDGTMPDMTHFEKKKRSSFIRSLFVLLAACLFLAGTAWIGFFVLQPKSHFSESGVIISVSGEEKVKVGEVQRYRVRYRNAQNVDLTNVLLQIRYPEGFIFTEASRNPTNEAKGEWILGGLQGQDSGYIDIYGKMYGTVGSQQSFRIFLNYKAENFAVEIESNASFSVRDSSPKQDQFVENRWNLKDAEGGKVTIKGVFDSALLEEDGNLVIRLVGWKDEDRSVGGYVYKSQEYLVKILEADLISNLVINGSSSRLTVQPGETLNGTIVLRNSGETPLKKVVARVVFDAPASGKDSILNWTAIDNPQNADIVGEQLSVGTRRGILTWDRDQILDLRQIDPAEEIIADFSLPIKSAEDVDLIDYVGSQIEATLEIRYELDGENKLISSAPIIMILNSDADLEVRDEIEYNGEQEKHTMTWVITNSFHELKDIKLEADIYGDIEWHDEDLTVGGGEVTYDEANKKLIWKIEKMPTTLDVIALQFSVTLKSKNPSQTNLTSKVIFEATDTITNEQILMMGKEILLNGE